MKSFAYRLLLLPAILFTSNIMAQEQSDSAKLLLALSTKAGGENKWDSALYYTNNLQILTRKEAGEISERNAQVLLMLGEVYRIKENFARACFFYKNSADVFAQLYPAISNLLIYSFAISRTGYMYDELGAKDEAKTWFLKAIAFNKQIKNEKENVHIYLQLANSFLDEGKYATADSAYGKIQEALDTLEKNAVTLYVQGAVYANKAKIYSETGDINSAINYLRKSFTYNEMARTAGQENNDCVQICLHLSILYGLSGKMDSAWAKCAEAEKNLSLNHTAFLNTQIIKTKAVLYQIQKKYAEAIALDKQYLFLSSFRPEKSIEFYVTKVNLGGLYNETKQWLQADSLFRDNIHQLRNAGLIYSFALQKSISGLGTTLINLKKYPEAIDTLISVIGLTFTAMDKNFSSMQENEKFKYRIALDEYFDLLYTCLYESQLTDSKKLKEIYALELRRKSLVLSSEVQWLSNIRNVGDSAISNDVQFWLNNRKILSKQFALPLGQRQFAIDSLESVNRMWEKKFMAYGLTSFANREIDIERLFKNQDKTTANIEFVRFQYVREGNNSAHYAAFIYHHGDSAPIFTRLCSEENLLTVLKDNKGRGIDNVQLTRHLYSANDRAAVQLYKLIWKPLEIWIKNDSTINYSPAGLLNNMAFPAIIGANGMLMQHLTFHRFFKLEDADSSDQLVNAPHAVSLWGDMDYDKASYSADSREYASNEYSGVISYAQKKGRTAKGFEPFQRGELSGLKNLFRSHRIEIVSFDHSNATEENFKQKATLTTDLLHISTHGFYFPLKENQAKKTLPADFVTANENPLFRCGLSFSGANHYWQTGAPKKDHEDGILTGFEVAALDLHNVKLVTLSACETGLGDVTGNEGNIGLQRAFKMAGVQKLLVSLWKVPAKQTAELLELFYTNWLAGASLSEALRKAELVMQKKYPPYFWAGFVLIE